jgi:ABC-type transport system substrate-binding protein
MLRWQDLTLAFVGMNSTLPPLDDARVREAVAMSIDRQAMQISAGRGDARSGRFRGLPGYTPVSDLSP